MFPDKLTFVAFSINGYFNVNSVTGISFNAEVPSSTPGKRKMAL